MGLCRLLQSAFDVVKASTSLVGAPHVDCEDTIEYGLSTCLCTIRKQGTSDSPSHIFCSLWN